ncbi:MAG: poly-gamma-glutamate synthase PgsB [Oscillospiraceae bacterium]|nr:poly-gamma-glutamate synthase PgsB [Oscillospiraceae bacterium]
MNVLIAVLALCWLAGLMREARQADADRAKLAHVVHVNGTRGKSTTSRLIEAGLRAGGLRVFCKTTGTDPMTIDVEGREELILRRGKANIKEQLGIMHRAAEQGAEVLVVECMAVQPEFQYAAQHRILKADVGVITNVRRDHTDVMGSTLAEICDALCNTVPKDGVLFTGEQVQAERMGRKARQMGSEFYPIRPDGTEPDFDFAENIALALAVCEHLGVDRATALEGMAGFKRDPFALSLHDLGEGVFINGLSINDIQSTCMVWEQMKEKLAGPGGRFIVLVNNRADRGSRTQDMRETAIRLAPDEVWLLGAGRGYMKRGIEKALPNTRVCSYDSAAALDFAGLGPQDVIFAIGNIAGAGRDLMARVREEGKPHV